MKNLFVAILICTVVTAFAQTSQPSDNADRQGTKAIEKVKETGEKAIDKTKEMGGKAVDKTKEMGEKAIDKTKEVGQKMKADKPAKPATPAKPKADKKMKMPKMEGLNILKDAGIGNLADTFKSMGLKKEDGKAIMGKNAELLKKAMGLATGEGNLRSSLKDLKGLNKGNLKDIKGMLTKDQFKQYKPIAKDIWTAVKNFIKKAFTKNA